MRNSIRLAAITALVLLSTALPALAEEAEKEKEKEKPKGAAPPDLESVVNGFQAWLVGLATALALLSLTVAGMFYLFSAGNPAQVERAKLIVRATVIGYSLMVLARIVLQALQGIVG